MRLPFKKGGIMAGKKKSGDIVVKVFRAGSKGTEVSLTEDRTINKAIEAAGLSKKESEVVQVNGEEVSDLHMDLDDGDRVVLNRNVAAGGVR